MKTTKKVKTVDIDDLISSAPEKDDDVIVPSYVSRTFLEPHRYGDGTRNKSMSTAYVYAVVGEIRNREHSYVDGSIEFGGESSPSCALYFNAFDPEEIEITLDKVDNFENEVRDFCEKMRESLEAYRVIAKVHGEGK